MSRPTCSPGLTRFDIPLRPKDGSKHYVLWVDTEGIIVPSVGDSIGIDVNYGIAGEVMSVDIFPTCNPMVYVVCRSLFPDDAAEAEKIVEVAKSKGWRV